MANTIAVTYQTTLDITETVPAASLNGLNAQKVILGTGNDLSLTLDSNSVPSPTKQAVGTLTLSGGAGTIDFSALTELNGIALDVSGGTYKLLAYRFRNKGANSMSISKGASNGLAAALGTLAIILPALTSTVPSQVSAVLGAGVTVDGTHKTLDVAGTGAQTLDYELVFGA